MAVLTNTYVLGNLSTNTYVVENLNNSECLIVDPALADSKFVNAIEGKTVK